MIITISGAACTGKTTLLESIRDRFSESSITLHYHQEFIRTVFASKYHDKYHDFADLLQGDPLDIIRIHKETARMFNEILWSSNLDDVLVFDRSPIDIAIYLYMNIAEYLDDEDVLSKYREASKYIYRCVQDFMSHNPIVCYTQPFSKEIKDDGFRPLSLIRRRELELSLFDKEFLSLPSVNILPSDLSKRVNIVTDLIVNNLNKPR